jgi:hypothetical protein
MNAIIEDVERETLRASREIAKQLRLYEMRVFDIIPNDQYDPFN